MGLLKEITYTARKIQTVLIEANPHLLTRINAAVLPRTIARERAEALYKSYKSLDRTVYRYYRQLDQQDGETGIALDRRYQRANIRYILESAKVLSLYNQAEIYGRRGRWSLDAQRLLEIRDSQEARRAAEEAQRLGNE